MLTAFEAPDAKGRVSLERDLIDLIGSYNRLGDDDVLVATTSR